MFNREINITLQCDRCGRPLTTTKSIKTIIFKEYTTANMVADGDGWIVKGDKHYCSDFCYQNKDNININRNG